MNNNTAEHEINWIGEIEKWERLRDSHPHGYTRWNAYNDVVNAIKSATLRMPKSEPVNDSPAQAELQNLRDRVFDSQAAKIYNKD